MTQQPSLVAAIDETFEPHDFSVATLATISERIARSRSLEEFVYRESELDDLWRILDYAVKDAHWIGDARHAGRLEIIRAHVQSAHDHVAADVPAPAEAMAALRHASTEVRRLAEPAKANPSI